MSIENSYWVKKKQRKNSENVYNVQYNVCVGKYWKMFTWKPVIVLVY